MDVIYLDFQKAFDKVSHKRLRINLKAHDAGDCLVKWTANWLTNRKQRVVVEGEESSWKQVDSGVP